MSKQSINWLISIVHLSVLILLLSFVITVSDTLSTQQLNIIDQCPKVRVMCVGDIMTHLPQVQSVQVSKKCKYDFSSIFKQVCPLLKKADIVIGNLETVLAGDQYGLSGYPEFNGPQILAYDLKKVGFTVITTANNHSFDQGVLGIKNTINTLDTAHLLHTGTFSDTNETDRFLLLNVKNLKIAILSYTYGTNGLLSNAISKHLNLMDTISIVKDIADIRNKNADVIIVSIHFGIEYSISPTEDQKQIVNFLWRNGVSIVFGHHPHVLQPMILDTVKNRFVIFSLGNFMTNQTGNNREFGAIADLIISKCEGDSTVNIDTASIHPTFMYHWYNKTHSQYSIITIEDLVNKKTVLKHADNLSKIADTISFINRSFHSLDGKFKYETNITPDSCR